MTRKVYVARPRIIDSDRRPGERENEVAYCAEPVWFFDDLPAAEYECRNLSGEPPVMVKSHRCEFAVESLEDGQFTIVCLSHPEDLKLSKCD